MKLLKKVWFVFILVALLIIPIVSYSATTTVTNEVELQSALNDPNIDTIIVSNSIQVSNTLTLPDDNRTINIQADPSNNVVISANGTSYIFNYTTTNNNLNINFENIILDGTLSSAIFYIDAQNGSLSLKNVIEVNGNNREDQNGGAIYTTDYTNLTIDGNNGTINFSQNYSQNPTSIEENEELIGLHNYQIIGDYTTSITPYLYNNDDINFVANLLMYEPNSQDLVQNLPPNVYYQTGQDVIVSDQTPVRVGYAFSGWNTYPDGSGTQYRSGDSFVMPDTRVTLFAQWQPIFYMLAFDANTSDLVENLPPSINYTVGEIITISEQTPIRTGYTFAGWNTNSDGSGTQYAPGDMFVGLEQDSTLYAQWEEDNNLIIIWIIIGILLLLIFVSIVLYSLCYVDCNCETCTNKNKRLF